ncbi:MAG TPA: FlgT C-terminal domain-containing protein [Pyrinomonadaceae bacterium]|nr:FlgT C-terminal domain-containing protein [Pyrinomonadaceae bacterium]
MSTKSSGTAVVLTIASIFALSWRNESQAQTTAQPTVDPASTTQKQSIGPQVVMPTNNATAKVAGRNTLYCAGYIKYQRFTDVPEIVGAEQEQEQRGFTEGEVVYMNWGSQQGIKVGDRFQIVRPRGQVKGVYKQKKGFLGIFVQEIGTLEVFKVQEDSAIAQITFSCSEALLGDLLTRMPYRESPTVRSDMALDRFADPTGKQYGRLMMSRDGREMLTRSDVVYIDLGAEDKVAAGDYLTIYRPLGEGTVTHVDNEEMARGRSKGFQSDGFRGGGFGIQAQRAKDTTAVRNAKGSFKFRPITSREVKRGRPDLPRKIIGEMVIIDVQTRTATAIITRVSSEVHTGDWVEIQ